MTFEFKQLSSWELTYAIFKNDPEETLGRMFKSIKNIFTRQELAFKEIFLPIST